MAPDLNDYELQYGDDGVLLNGETHALNRFILEGAEGLSEHPPIRQTTKEFEGNHGTFTDTEFFSARTIVLDGFADTGGPENVELYLDDLKRNYRVSNTSRPFYFKIPQRPIRFCYAKSLGVKHKWTTERNSGKAIVQIQLFCEDPLIYSDEKTASVGLATSSPGIGFPHSFPYSFGGVSASNQINAFNAGNIDTPVEFTITGPCSNPEIINDITGQRLKFVITLGAGEYLTVDNHYKTVLLNGEINRRSALQEPNWFNLEPGNNYLRYTAMNVTSSTLTAKWTDAWQ